MTYPKALDSAALTFGIDTKLRKAHWLAQLAHESAGFKVLEENLNYSAKALRATWPGRFDAETAQSHARNPEKIANRVYGGRLGNDQPGDGWKYRGRGYIQLTGKANYAKYSELVFGDKRLVDSPDLAKQPEVAALLAGAYWKAANLNQFADRDDIVSITRRINGGLIGLESRKKWLEKMKDSV